MLHMASLNPKKRGGYGFTEDEAPANLDPVFLGREERRFSEMQIPGERVPAATQSDVSSTGSDDVKLENIVKAIKGMGGVIEEEGRYSEVYEVEAATPDPPVPQPRTNLKKSVEGLVQRKKSDSQQRTHFLLPRPRRKRQSKISKDKTEEDDKSEDTPM
ncbi:hypothetical protein HOLleu_29398 [Holothuria leucospilota]|uniref:Uncharacterized protein n=1 Tax=Holothuria leucospilota TaxID=206669 RepID=A0A9Q1BNE5_HOLLE|nr:hypothetical protein HOLleu_29398 [Holothuria leucospilota]